LLNDFVNESTFAPMYAIICPWSGADIFSGCQNFTLPAGKHTAEEC
jgi:hypothetical protein